MLKNFLLPILLSALHINALCQLDIKSWHTALPPALAKDAWSVMQYGRTEFTVTSIDKAAMTVRQVITVLDTRGDNALSFAVHTNKFVKLGKVSIVLYDNMGHPGKTFTKKDLAQDAVYSGLVEDGMYYHLKFSPSKLPATIEYNYTVEYNGILNYPSFYIQEPNQSVRHAEFVATVPKALGLRYKNQHTDIEAQKTENDGSITYHWEADNLAALQNEPGSVSWTSNFPKVLIAPNKFKLDDYPGDMASWEGFGKWYAALAAKSLDLTTSQQQYIKSLVSNATTDREKINILYQHLQQNFRYVSIQLGIGGFKPFKASFTHDKKYGDCKALSNYMQACLSVVGIKSYQALINSDYNVLPVDENFPINRFNHMILCVPGTTDSLWLECTSKYNEPGVLGNFTENRNALLITENGGVLVPTPKSKASQNRRSIKTTIQLQDDGSGEAALHITATGEYRLDLVHGFQDESADKQKEGLISILGIPVPERFSLVLASAREAALGVDVSMAYEKIPAFSAGGKMFLHPRLQKIWQYSLPKARERKLDFYFSHPFEKNDTTVYVLPAGFVVESMPEATGFSCQHARYASKTWYNEATREIVSVASLRLNQYKIPAMAYQETADFFGKIIGDETHKIVVRKQ